MTSPTTTAGSDTERPARLDVLEPLYRAWEANDAEAFVADYTDDASVVQPGVYKKDREEIRTTMAAALLTRSAGRGRPTVRWTSAFWPMTRPSWSARAGSSSLGSTLSRASGWCARPGCWSRRDDAWRIASYHNSPASQGAVFRVRGGSLPGSPPRTRIQNGYQGRSRLARS